MLWKGEAMSESKLQPCPRCGLPEFADPEAHALARRDMYVCECRRVPASRIITIVAKGPSAAHAQEWIDECPGCDVATINEAGLLLRQDQPIRFGFFCHVKFAERMRPLWARIDCLVSPSELIGPQELPVDFPVYKRMFYEANQCCGTWHHLVARLALGRVTHHHTVTAAMSWLAKIGYRRLRIIGVGGQGYAPGLDGQPKLPEDLSVWPRVEHILAGILHDLYGAETERYDESDHPRESA
jgi:hypothetical protein